MQLEDEGVRETDPSAHEAHAVRAFSAGVSVYEQKVRPIILSKLWYVPSMCLPAALMVNSPKLTESVLGS